MNKPEWWPENPYFEAAMVSIKSDADYAKAIPDTQLRTAVSWYLCNRTWELASAEIFKQLQEVLQAADDLATTVLHTLPNGASNPKKIIEVIKAADEYRDIAKKSDL